MQLYIIIVLLAISQLGTASLMRNWMSDFENRFSLEEQEGSEGAHRVFNPFQNMMTRSRRSDKVKMCGGKVWKMVMVTCGGQCTRTDTNIATACCETMCTMEEITGLCCP